MDIISYFSVLKEKEFKFEIDYRKEEQAMYLEKRQKILKILKKMITCYKYKQSTLYLAAVYIDKIMLKNPSLCYEPVLCGCLLLAAKFNENNPYIPTLMELSASFQGIVSAKDIQQAECFCLKILEYKLDYLNVFDLNMYLTQNGIIFVNELTSNSKYTLDDVYGLTQKILDEFIYDNRFLDFSQFEICFALVFLAKELCGINNNWNKTFQRIYNIPLDEFSNSYIVLKR
jgi:hypothetical protein